MTEPTDPGLFSRRAAEIAFSLFTAGIGIAIISGAREHETGWGDTGPEAGYFPLRIGIVIVVASVLVLIKEGLRRNNALAMLSRPAARQIAVFLLPLIAFIMLIPWIGLYLGAALYLAVAVGAIGRVPWIQALSIAVATPSIIFIVFEFLFVAPLPKGPLGPLLGML